MLYDYSGNISAAQELQSLESEIYKQLKRPASTIIIRSICPKINVNTWWYSLLWHPQFRNTGRAETECSPRDVQRGEELGGVGEVLEEGNGATCVFKVVCVLWKKVKSKSRPVIVSNSVFLVLFWPQCVVCKTESSAIKVF